MAELITKRRSALSVAAVIAVACAAVASIGVLATTPEVEISQISRRILPAEQRAWTCVSSIAKGEGFEITIYQETGGCLAEKISAEAVQSYRDSDEYAEDGQKPGPVVFEVSSFKGEADEYVDPDFPKAVRTSRYFVMIN